jgi:prophage maintenance system killer protein
LKKPDLRLAIAINQRVRSADEWFDEPDELDRIESALLSIEGLIDPVEAAGVLAFRVTRAQAFAEGNKRTALLLAKWILDNNDHDSRQIIDPDDRALADLLVRAASGQDLELDIVRYFTDRG